MKDKTVFVFYFWFVSWKSISLGVSLNLSPLHLEIHVPFGFIKIGRDKENTRTDINWQEIKMARLKYERDIITGIR